jgi:hypothetical protein
MQLYIMHFVAYWTEHNAGIAAALLSGVGDLRQCSLVL